MLVSRTQWTTFLFHRVEMHMHNDELSPEDSVLFKLIEKLIGSQAYALQWLSVIFRKCMWMQQFILLPLLIHFAFFSGSKRTHSLFSFTKQTDSGSLYALGIGSPVISQGLGTNFIMLCYIIISCNATTQNLNLNYFIKTTVLWIFFFKSMCMTWQNREMLT